MLDELTLELQQQLHDQIEALASIEEALAAGGHDEELLAVKQQLEEAIPALRDSLAELQPQHHAQADVTHAVDIRKLASDASWQSVPDWIQTGAICRFRYQNGRWYHGVVDSVQQEQPMPVQLHFRFPTRSFMLHSVHLPAGLVLPGSSSSSSKSQQQQQLSVGSRVLALPPGQQLWQPAEITAISTAAAAAAAESSSDEYCCTAILVDTGQAFILPLSAVTLSATADVSQAELDNTAAPNAAAAATSAIAAASESAAACDSDMSSSDSEASDGSSSSGFDSDRDDSEQEAVGQQQQQEEEADAGVEFGGVMAHARLAVAAGAQTETATFADWEHHGRGIASRLMARMGFKRGGGLGKAGTGISNPLDIHILPSKKGLGAVDKKKQHKAHGTGSKKNKQSRGGERKRRRKAAAARHAARAESRDRQQRMEAATGSEGLFAFINHSLGDGSEAADRLRDVVGGEQQQQQQRTGGAGALASAAAAAGGGGRGGHGSSTGHRQQQQQQLDRKGLIGSQDDLAEKKARVAQLAAMLARNKTNRGLAPQIQAKLQAAQRQLDAATAEHRQLHKAVARKEATEKWIKF